MDFFRFDSSYSTSNLKSKSEIVYERHLSLCIAKLAFVS